MFSCSKLAATIAILAGLVASQGVYSQTASHINWQTDTISETTARGAQFKFRSEWSGAGKKTTATITLPVSKLKDIVDACTAKGIDDVQFFIVTIRSEDLDHYARQRPGMSSSDKADMVGRQMLVIKVPRSAFFAGQSGFNKSVPGNNPLMLSLLGAGLFRIDHPENLGITPWFESSVYFSFGEICPPPSSCD